MYVAMGGGGGGRGGVLWCGKLCLNSLDPSLLLIRINFCIRPTSTYFSFVSFCITSLKKHIGRSETPPPSPHKQKQTKQRLLCNSDVAPRYINMALLKGAEHHHVFVCLFAV